jgi:hypothetical protein
MWLAGLLGHLLRLRIHDFINNRSASALTRSKSRESVPADRCATELFRWSNRS